MINVYEKIQREIVRRNIRRIVREKMKRNVRRRRRRRYEWGKKGLGWRRGCLTDFTACWPCSIDAVLAI